MGKSRKEISYGLVTESENIEQLKAEQKVLSALSEEVSRLSEVYQSMQPLEDKICDKIKTVEQGDQTISRRFICDLQSDSGNIRSGRNSLKSGQRSHKSTWVKVINTQDDDDDRTYKKELAETIYSLKHRQT